MAASLPCTVAAENPTSPEKLLRPIRIVPGTRSDFQIEEERKDPIVAALKSGITLMRVLPEARPYFSTPNLTRAARPSLS